MFTKTISKTFKRRTEYPLKISILDAKCINQDGQDIVLDEPLVDNMLSSIFKSISKNTSKYNQMPKSILISQDKDLLECMKNLNEIDKENRLKDNNEIIDIYDPRYDFDSVYINESSKHQILAGLTIIKNRNKLFKEWGLENSMKGNRALVFNFYGLPGTGKSMTAEAIANYLGKKVFSVNYAQLESKYVGETPKNIKMVFEKAKKENAVLIFDEADSFLGKRLTNISQSADYGVNITRSVMLLELEKFDGVVIFTTNLLDNYDDAFKRRILANIEFKLPDELGREKIWKTHIPSQFPLDSSVSIGLLAKKYENISGADIKDIILFAGVNAISNNREVITESDFDLAHKYIISRYNVDNNKFKNIKIKTTKISKEDYQKEIGEERV